MIELYYNNDYVKIAGKYTKEIISEIKKECSYFSKSAEWALSYQTQSWDGFISLFNTRNLTFPAGLLSIVTSLLHNLKIPYTILDQRAKPTKTRLCEVDISPYVFRDYQEAAINAFEEKSRGIISSPTGSGKTSISSGIISKISVYPVIFIVPSVSLLKQTIKAFEKVLKPLKEGFFIGELGGGVFNPSQAVTVATYQTLLTAYDKKYSEQKKKIIDIEDKTSLESLERQLKILHVDFDNSPQAKLKSIQKKIKETENKITAKHKTKANKAKIRELIESCQLLMIDETHIAAEIIETLSLKAKNAYYKCGLSATARRNDNQDIRMFGATGPIIYSVTCSDLIKRGFLVKPKIFMIDLDPLEKTGITYQEVYKNAIVLNQERNELIRDLATEMYSQGRPTIIMVERIEHGKILESMIENSLFVPGGDGSNDEPLPEEELNYRRYQLDRLENNEHILICTSWSFCGIDAPKISCLILACSISSNITCMQQIGRGLRSSEGKSDCVVFDFKHTREKSLKNHSNSRLRTYKTESEFQIKVLKYNPITQSYT